MDATAYPIRPARACTGPHLLALALAAALSLPAQAQESPQQLPAPDLPDLQPARDDGPGCRSGCAQMSAQDPQQLAPTPQMEADFVLQRVVFRGATAFAAPELEALVADRIGRTVTFADLQQLAQRVTRHYHEHGYILAQAILPVQEVVDGTVEISVVEGRLGRVSLELDPATPISEERIASMLAPLAVGEPLDGQRYERTMLLMSDLPGVRPQSVLETGRQAGSSDLVVQVAPGDRVRFNVELDNHGTEEVGRWRLGGTLRWASPLRIGDNLDLRLLASDDRLFDGDGTLFGRIAYELPLGSNGTRLGMGASQVYYSLGGGFEILDAIGIARIYDIGVTHPLIRQRGQNLFLRGFVDRKELTDELRAVGFKAEKRITGVGASWAWERRDGFGGGGYWSSSGALYHGELDLLDEASRAVDDSILGRGIAGSFNKLTVQAARLQALGERLSLYVAIGGQVPDRNLDASEKLALGGPRAVRAYEPGDVLVDEGAIANIELRWAMSQSFTGFVFYDIGSGSFNHTPGQFDTDNDRTLRGPGIGLNYGGRNGFSASATVAWPQTHRTAASGGDRSPMAYVQMMKSF